MSGDVTNILCPDRDCEKPVLVRDVSILFKIKKKIKKSWFLFFIIKKIKK